MAKRGRQRGVVLILVLWVIVLVTITTGAFTILARTETLQAHHLLASTQARYAAEAGLNLAVTRLRNPNLELQWVADGRAYRETLDDIKLEIKIVDERGKLDINAADELVLASLFIAQDFDEQKVAELVDAILDWRDADDEIRINGAEDRDYEAAGLPYGPANAPFIITEELQQVLGLNYALFRQIEPAITVYSRRGLIDAAFAPYEALLTLPGMTPDEARRIVEEREQIQPGDEMDLLLPDGTAARTRGQGNTFSITVKATMPNGIWEQIEATVALVRSQTDKPYQVLRWREGVKS